MRLIDDAGAIWHRLWSIRFALLAALLSAADAGWQAWVSGNPRWIAIITAVLSVAGALARLVKQPKLNWWWRHG